jgi:ABC-2 type transport system permease protein
MMKREGTTRRAGSPWTGLWAVVMKEMADHLSSARMRVLEGLILLVAIGTVYVAIRVLRTVVGEDPFLFLRLFTVSGSEERDLSFVSFLIFLIPLIGIALGFDAINGEHNRRTLSRVLSQPIYRDALLLGKFLAGLFTIAIMLVALWLLVTGLGMFRLGVVPSGAEVARGLLFLMATVAYAGIWLAMAMCFSVVYRQPATSALGALAVWLFFAIFWGIIARNVAQVLRPVESAADELARFQIQLWLSRLSPDTLYSEMVLAFLNPTTRFFGLPSSIEQIIQLRQAGINAPLPLSQSLALVWPQFFGLIAAGLIVFAVAYMYFQRQEVRA